MFSKGKGRGKNAKSANVPKRVATWHTAEDVPHDIKEHIVDVYKAYTFSRLLDHQVRSKVNDGSFDPLVFRQLVQNSGDRSTSDASNLIRLVYNQSRARPVYRSPSRRPISPEY